MNRNALQTSRKNVARRASTASRNRRPVRPQAVGAACATVIERLEERTLMSTVNVMNNGDSGAGSLRAAIASANSGDTINFTFGGSHTISLLSALNVNKTLTIDGTGQSVVIQGNGGAFDAMDVTAPNTVISALTIVHFGGAGIDLKAGSDGSALSNNLIGTFADGTASGNFQGVVVESSYDTLTGNVISASAQEGVSITAGGSFASLQGNFIGTDPTGLIALGNGVNAGKAAVAVNGADHVTIGGNTLSARNVISGNFGDGILFSAATNGLVAGNFIGVDKTGQGALGNGASGVEVAEGSSNITIGGSDGSSGNVLSSNRGNGIFIDASSNVTVSGNLIGTDSNGLRDRDDNGFKFGNQGGGVSIGLDSFGNVIGGTTSPEANFIDNNRGNGIDINTFDAENNLVEGNFIGVGTDTLTPLGNEGNGVFVSQISGNPVGGIPTITGNIIAANLGEGVLLNSTAVVNFNYIGTDPNGTTTNGNIGDGVDINSSNNLVTDNVIAFNYFSGVIVTNVGDPGIGNTIRRNSIYANNASGDTSGEDIGIDLLVGGNFGVTENDSEGHDGPNNFQNFPVITSAKSNGSTITIKGTLDSLGANDFTIDFYSNSSDVADTITNHGGGQTYLGSAVVTTDGSGHATFTAVLIAPSADQTVLSATATDADGNTSEFALNAPIETVANTAVATTTTLASSLNPSSVGQSVTFTATVTASGNPVTTGSVTFSIDGVPTSPVTVDTNGHATFTTSSLTAGAHTITADYGANPSFDESVSAPLTQTVNKITTSTTIASSLNPSTFGQSVMFTAHVSAASGSPVGSVIFTLDGTAMSPVTIDGSGNATFTTSSLVVGPHTISAAYSGDATTFAASNSADLTQNVNKISTTTSLTSSANPSVFGQMVTFTATVTSGATGSVTFSIDGNPTTVALTSGVATLSVSTLSVEGHSVTATYNGDSHYATSTTSLTQTVNAASTTTTVNTSLTPSVFGQSVTFTAIVAPVAPGAGTPTGSVQFLDGATVLATVTIDASGHAVFSTSALAEGPHTIVAQFTATGLNFTNSQGSVAQDVGQDATSLTIASSANPSVFGQNVVFTATVSANAPGSGTPSGTVTFMDGATTLGTGTLVGGIATFSTSNLSVASHSITAVYSGDTNDAGTSASLAQVVNKANTATSVTTSGTPSTFGSAVTFTATVAVQSPGAGTLAGTVTFKDGATVLGTVAISGSTASLTTSALTAGSHSITATYSADASFNDSTGSLTQVVTSAQTTTAVTSSLNPSTFGQAVTFTATVSGAAASAGDTVTFMDGATVLAANVAMSGNTASLTTSSLSVGNHSITAVYSGNSNVAGSTSAALTQVVNAATTSTTLASSLNPSNFGDTVTFTATVSSSTGAPTGSVTFMDGATSLATVALSGNAASFSTSSLATGHHNITAVYSGDASFNASTSTTVDQLVNKLDSSTTIVSSQNPSTFGQTVTFTATVAGSGVGGSPTGSVTFIVDGNVMAPIALDASGTASFSTAALSVGGHTVSAAYSGSNIYSASAQSMLQTVNKAASSTTLTSSQNPSAFGQSVTFTATVASAGIGGSPTGSVTFTIDGSPTTVAVAANGTATLTTSSLSVGTHNVTATYGGDSTFNTSAATPLTQNVNADATSTTVNSNANPSVFGQAVTFTAHVNIVAPGAGTATGTVTFMDGATTLGTATLGGGVATLTTSALSVGSHSITAVYSGDANDTGSTSAALSQNVNKAATATTVTTSVTPSVFGQSVTFTASVGVLSPGAGALTGTVTFMDGATALGTVALSGGVASLSTAGLSVGGHTITATYSGDSNFAASTGTVSQAVNDDVTTTTVTSSLNPSAFGQSVTFTATVVVNAPGAGTPSGVVTFKDGSITLGTGTLNSSGLASYTTNSLSVGSHQITATYGGDGNDFTSSSTALTQTVNKDATSTSVASSANPSVFGQAVTFTATVSGGVNVASDTVTFMDGATTLGTGTLNGSGVATFTTSSLSVGAHSITAVFGGDSTNNGSTSASLTQNVNQAATTTTVTSSLNPAASGATVTFTASVGAVAPGAGVATGTVTFKDGTTVLGTGTLNASGVVTLSTSFAAAGSHAITAVYGGDTKFTGSTGSLTENVTASLASVSGTVFADTTGNGLTADDTPLAGVTVTLFKDNNNDGVLNTGDTQVGSPVVTGASGVYSFSGLATGRYLVDQTTPNGYVRTAPALADYYAVNATAGSSTSNLNFDDYQMECVLSNFYNIYYVIDGATTVTDLAGNTQPGDEVTVYFTAKPNTSDELTLVSYTAPDAFFNANDASQQVIFDQITVNVNTGATAQTFNATVQIPSSNYQIDFVCGPAIDHLGPNGSNIFYHQENRFFSSDNGGNGVVATNVGSAISGIVFCDENLNGVLDAADDIPSGAIVSLKNSGGSVIATTTTGANGSYSFTGITPGTYSVFVSTPAAGHLAGPINGGAKSITVVAGSNVTQKNFAEVQPGNFSGFVWADENSDGKIDFNEAGVINVTITLSGTDCFGHTFTASTITDADGQYIFSNVNPGTYKLTETQPTATDFTQGHAYAGVLGGTASGTDTITSIALGGCGDNAINYNFSELGKAIVHGATATIGFWHNNNGQALLKALNGGPNSTAMGNWLANNFGMYSMFANKTNTYVANFYNNNDFAASGQKLDAQVLAAAFACYVTNSTWAGGTYAASYGFTVNNAGSGYQTVNVGSNGAAFGVSNNSNITILQALQATDAQSTGTTLYNGNTTLRNQANTIYTLINQGGDIT